MSDQDKSFDPNYLSLPQLLNDFTIAQIKEMALTLGFRFKGNGKKAGLVACMADTLLEMPELIIKTAYFYELKAWLDIIEGRMTMSQAEASGFLFALNRFGLVYSFRRKEDNIFFQPDLAERLKPLIPAELERREKDGSYVLEKLALGLANLYSYTTDRSIQQYFSKVEKHLGKKLDEDFLNIALQPFLADTRYGLGEKLERPLFSPLDYFVEFDISTDIDFKIEAKEFDIETILNFGEMPYPVFSGKQAESLKRIISKYGAPECNSDYIMRKLWLDQQDKNASPIPNLDFLRLPDFSAAQECINAVIDFQNNVPYWKLRGHSSAEIGARDMAALQAKGQAPKIVMGPNMRAMGIESFEQIQEMARRGEELPPLPSNPVNYMTKVGRNDPCPCGSGKKYKHCCGR